MKKLTRKQIATMAQAGWDRILTLAADSPTIDCCYVEAQSDNGPFLVKCKPYPDYMGEIVTLETFNDKPTAEQYRDLTNQIRLDYLKLDAARAANAGTTAYANGELETEDFNNVEIIRAGTWHPLGGGTVKITKQDVADGVANFAPTKDALKPYLKLGHMTQDAHLKFTGMPSLGWMENVRLSADGNSAIADFKQVPKKFAQLLHAKSFRRVSAEVLRNFTDQAGKTYRFCFKAAGVLGAMLPACNTMNDFIDNYFGGVAPSQSLIEIEGGELIALADLVEESAMTKEQLAALRKTLNLADDADEATVLAATAALAQTATANATALANAHEQAFADGVNTRINKAKAEGRLLPANEAALRMAVAGWRAAADKTEGNVIAFAMGEKEIKGTVLECLDQYLAAQATVIQLGVEMGSNAQPGEVGDIVPEGMLPRDIEQYARSTRTPIAMDSVKANQRIMKRMKETETGDYVEAFTAATGVSIPLIDSEELAMRISGRVSVGR